MICRLPKEILFIQHRMGDGGVTYSLASLLSLLTRNKGWKYTLLLRFHDNNPRMDLIPANVSQVWLDECSEDFFNHHYHAVVAYMPDMADILDRFKKVDRRVLWIHGDYSGFNDDIKSSVSNAMQKVDVVITPSQKASESVIHLVPSYQTRVFTVPHTMPEEAIRKLSLDEIHDWPETQKVTALTIGHLVYNAKGIDRMIRVHRKLLDEGFDFRWIVIGDGPDREWIEDMIRKERLEANFLLLGFRKNPYPYLRKADLFAILSYHEGYSLALNEAKILEKPIIATRFAGADDQIDHMLNGMVVENNEESILEGMRLILSDPLLRERFQRNLHGYKHPNKEIINWVQSMFLSKQVGTIQRAKMLLRSGRF